MTRTGLRQCQQGFTLVEMLVAMAISLVLSGALVMTYLGSLQTNRATMALAQLHEDGQAALALLAQQLRQAGYNPAPPGATAARDLHTGRLTLFACDAGFESASAAMASLQCRRGTEGPGALAIAYLADRFNTVPTAETPPRATDCVGSGIVAVADGSGPYYVAQNRFFVANGNLMCVGSGGTKPFTNPQPFVENVEDLRLAFGMSLPQVSGALTAGYLRAAEIGGLAGNDGVLADAGFLALSPAQRWAGVASVRVCVLMRSADVVLEQGSAPQPYLDCGGGLRNATDGRLRRAFTATVLLRNRAAPA